MIETEQPKDNTVIKLIRKKLFSGEYDPAEAAGEAVQDFDKKGFSNADIYEGVREGHVYLSEGNMPGLTREHMIKWDDMVICVESILTSVERGFELPDDGSRISDFRLVPLPVEVFESPTSR